MKVKFIDFEEGVARFAKKIIDSMPTTGHKFLAGAMFATSAKKLEDALSAFAVDGIVDTDEVRKLVKSGVEYSGDKVSFTVGDPSVSWLVKPVTVNITMADVEEALKSVEARYGVA